MSQASFEDIKYHDLISKIDAIAKNMGDTLSPSAELIKMVITIPAKNESESITNTLEAIGNQKFKHKILFDRSHFEVLVLCHNCSDDTFSKCQRFSSGNNAAKIHCLELNSEELNTVGAARRVLMNIASERLPEHGFIITTDADTIPNANWLAKINSYLDTDVDLVCGFIKSDYESVDGQTFKYLQAKDEYLMLTAQLEHILLPNPSDPWPKHSYHWGPNLAIRNNVYKAIGGLRPLHFLEDVDMYNRVVSKGFSVRHCMDTVVTTSTRIDSRCDEGFGAELKIWTEWEGVSYNVEGLKKLKTRFEIHKLLKQFYALPNIELLERVVQLANTDRETLLKLIHKHKNPEAIGIAMQLFLDSHEPFHIRFPKCSVFEACEEIRNYVSN